MPINESVLKKSAICTRCNQTSTAKDIKHNFSLGIRTRLDGSRHRRVLQPCKMCKSDLYYEKKDNNGILKRV